MERILTLALCTVIFVNGFTDAPNAVACVIATRAARPMRAMVFSCLFNFLGVYVMCRVSPLVADTVMGLVDFSGSGGAQGLVALGAGLVSVVIWATCAWVFSIPTSESHALLAGVTGAGIAAGGWQAVRLRQWASVFQGLFLSVLLGAALGYIAVRLLARFFQNARRQRADCAFRVWQNLSSFFMSFMHGAQDGQKFVGVFLLIRLLARGESANVSSQTNLVLLCALIMGIGTLCAGKRIIKAVGMDMVRLSCFEGFCADLCGGLSLLAATLWGMPVSTTHAKTAAIIGVGLAANRKNVRLSVFFNMLWAWVLTFPCCLALGYLSAVVFGFLF